MGKRLTRDTTQAEPSAEDDISVLEVRNGLVSRVVYFGLAPRRVPAALLVGIAVARQCRRKSGILGSAGNRPAVGELPSSSEVDLVRHDLLRCRIRGVH